MWKFIKDFLQARFARNRIFLLILFILSLTTIFWSLTSMFPKPPDPIEEDFDAIKLKIMHLRRGQIRAADEPMTEVSKAQLPTPPPFNDTIDIGTILSNTHTCRNSVQGMDLIADDRGFVCTRQHVTSGGCCKTNAPGSSTQFACNNCEQDCCAKFEFCVSCCLHPDKKPLLQRVLRQQSLQAGNYGIQTLFSLITDHFEFCLAKCRTSSQSVLHENSYRNPKKKHCYGVLPNEIPKT